MGAFWGSASGILNFASGGGTIWEQLFKHTFSQGWLEGVQGGNIFHGFMMGAVSGASGFGISQTRDMTKTLKIISASIVSGTIDEIGGGKFANGAVTGAFSILFNDMMHDINQRRNRNRRKFPAFSEIWKNYPKDVNNKHAHPSRDGYANQCAIRLGVALMKSGVDFTNYSEPVTSEGFPRGAFSLANWIYSNYGPPTNIYNSYSDFQKATINQTGIMFEKHPYQGTADHIDVWNKGKSGSGVYISFEIWFWNIK